MRRTGALVKKSVITSGGASLIIDLISTPTRRGVPFTRVRRRGLCSMSGRYPYGIGNPPTLRRSSFPQRASRPAGGPIPNCPKTPVAGCAGYGLIYGGSRKSIRTAHRIAPKVATGVSALSPHPLSRWRERGPDGLATINREQRSRGVRACKNRKPPTLKYLFSRPIVPLL